MKTKYKKATGPEPEVIKIQGNWETAIKKALTKPRPESGWPKPKAKKK